MSLVYRKLPKLPQDPSVTARSLCYRKVPLLPPGPLVTARSLGYRKVPRLPQGPSVTVRSLSWPIPSVDAIKICSLFDPQFLEWFKMTEDDDSK